MLCPSRVTFRERALLFFRSGLRKSELLRKIVSLVNLAFTLQVGVQFSAMKQLHKCIYYVIFLFLQNEAARSTAGKHYSPASFSSR